LVVIPGQNILEGIPVTGEFGEASAKEKEEFTFRLEARDSQNAVSLIIKFILIMRPATLFTNTLSKGALIKLTVQLEKIW